MENIVSMELKLWKNKSEKVDSSMEAFKSVSLFLNIKCLLLILSIVPYTTQKSNRLFSSLKRIKIYL